MKQDYNQHVMKYGKLYLISLIAAVATWLVIIAAAELFDVPVKILTRDPYRAARVPAYYAYASLFGSTVWLVSGAATLMTALILRRTHGCRLSDDSHYRLILPGGLIGLVMGIDDILLIHDAMATSVGIPEILFHILYFGSIGLMILYSRKQLFSTPWLLLLGALVGFVLSSVVDILKMFPATIQQSEDLFKICGIVLWSVYLVSLSWTFANDLAKKS